MAPIDDPATDRRPRIALVTGAAKRIGRAIALTLAKDGWQVAIHYNRSIDEADALRQEIEAAGGRAATVRADLSDPEETASLVKACCDALGPPNCLVNNASLFFDDTLETLEAEIWEQHFSTNLRAPVFLARDFASALPEGETGNVVNIIDQRVLRPSPEFFSYAIAKAGLWQATRMMAQALAPGIRVNAVAPGPVLQSIHQAPEDFSAEVASTLLQRACPPEEIAAAVMYILASPSLTGQMITLDAGQHLS